MAPRPMVVLHSASTSESIRDFIAFPKNNAGRDVMLDAPSTIDEKQLVELQIKSTAKQQ